MSDSNKEQNRALACLRLASEDAGGRRRGPGHRHIRILFRDCRAVHRHQNARQHGRSEIGPCGEQPLAGNTDTRCIGSCSVAAGRSAAEGPLSREAIRCGGDGSRTAFAGWSRGVSVTSGGENRGNEPFCSCVLPISGLMAKAASGLRRFYRAVRSSVNNRQADGGKRRNECMKRKRIMNCGTISCSTLWSRPAAGALTRILRRSNSSSARIRDARGAVDAARRPHQLSPGQDAGA
jgi:hypothetical protein